MIFKETQFSILDNSGAKKVLCIKVLGRTIGYPGDIVIATIKRAIHKKLRKKKILKKGEIYKILLVSCRKGFMRKTGVYIGGFANYGVVLRRDNMFLPFGNRMRSPVFREVRGAFSKIILMCPGVI